jgi:hypothetical protein
LFFTVCCSVLSGGPVCLCSVLIFFCYSEGHEGHTVWALHNQWEEVEEDSDGEVPGQYQEMFYLADRALSAAYFPAPAEETAAPVDVQVYSDEDFYDAPAEDMDTAVMSLSSSLVYLPASTIMPSDGLDTVDPPVDMVTDAEETDALGQIFCGANPFCYTCYELADMAEKNIDVVDWKSPSRKRPRMGIRVPVCVQNWPKLCDHHQEWLDKNLSDKWSWVFHAYVQFGFPWDLHQPAIIRGVKLMVEAYVGDGSGFHTQVAIYEQGYSNTFTFALALYRDGTAAGYLRYPYIVITGPSVPASAAEINTP